MRASRWIGTMVALALAGWVTSAAVVAKKPGEVAGAGAAPYATGTTFNLVPVYGLQFGVGAAIAVNGLGTGDLHVTLLGTSVLNEAQVITFDGNVSGLSVIRGVATLSGTGILDMGGAGAAIIGVPYTLTTTGNTVLLVLGTTTLPQVTLSQGTIMIK